MAKSIWAVKTRTLKSWSINLTRDLTTTWGKNSKTIRGPRLDQAKENKIEPVHLRTRNRGLLWLRGTANLKVKIHATNSNGKSQETQISRRAITSSKSSLWKLLSKKRSKWSPSYTSSESRSISSTKRRWNSSSRCSLRNKPFLISSERKIAHCAKRTPN